MANINPSPVFEHTIRVTNSVGTQLIASAACTLLRNEPWMRDPSQDIGFYMVFNQILYDYWEGGAGQLRVQFVTSVYEPQYLYWVYAAHVYGDNGENEFMLLVAAPAGSWVLTNWQTSLVPRGGSGMVMPDPVFGETLEIWDVNQTTLAYPVQAAVLRHEMWMRDPASDVAFYMDFDVTVYESFTGVFGSIEVIWRSFAQHFKIYAVLPFENFRYMLLVGVFEESWASPAASSVPTLQQVTDSGSDTTVSGIQVASPFMVVDDVNAKTGALNVTDRLSANRTYNFPNNSGTVRVGPPYYCYIAIVDQIGTSAPIANVLENTFSAAPVWTRTGTGACRATLAGAFVDGKTFATIHLHNFNGDAVFLFLIYVNTNYMALYSNNDGLVATDGFTAFVEIRVYHD